MTAHLLHAALCIHVQRACVLAFPRRPCVGQNLLGTPGHGVWGHCT